MQQMHMHKAVTVRVEAQKLLSRRRQSDYSSCFLCCEPLTEMITLQSTKPTLAQAGVAGDKFVPQHSLRTK